jgi:hypothetical protein
MPTSISGSSAYCSNSEFLKRYDSRTVGELLSDTGEVIDPVTLASDTTLTALLQQASGMVEAAAFEGRRYDSDDLEALDGNSVALLRGLVADLGMWLLWNRRPDRGSVIPPQVTASMEMLDQLRMGKRIFSLQEQADAGSKMEIIDSRPETGLVKRLGRIFGCLDA